MGCDSRAGRLIRTAAAMSAMLAVLALAGCAPQEMILGSDDDGEAVRVAVGEMVVVELAGNPTTGFEWTEDDPVPTILERQSAEYVQDEAPSDMVGVGGTYRFRYEAVAEGEDVLSFTYARPGEPPPEVDDTWGVTIHVDPDE